MVEAGAGDLQPPAHLEHRQRLQNRRVGVDEFLLRRYRGSRAKYAAALLEMRPQPSGLGSRDPAS